MIIPAPTTACGPQTKAVLLLPHPAASNRFNSSNFCTLGTGTRWFRRNGPPSPYASLLMSPVLVQNSAANPQHKRKLMDLDVLSR